MSATAGPARVVLHHEIARVALGAFAGIGGLALAAGDPARRGAGGAWLVAVVAVVAVLGWRPALVVDDSGVAIRNPLRDVRIPWSRVEDVAMGWTLTVTAQGRTHRVWAVPGPRRMRSMYERRWTDGGTLERLAPLEVDRAGAAGGGGLGLGEAGLVVAQRWAARAALVPAGTPVRVTWSRSTPALLAVAALAAAAGVVAG